jgi:putative ATP-dependent endonuclease of the OLD family
MFLRRIAVQNFRSFREKEELILDGSLSIIIGPNGGGKTNLLDICILMLQRHFVNSIYLESIENILYYRSNEELMHIILEPHSGETQLFQMVEIELEVTEKDFENMQFMQNAVQSIDVSSEEFRQIESYINKIKQKLTQGCKFRSNLSEMAYIPLQRLNNKYC